MMQYITQPSVNTFVTASLFIGVCLMIPALVLGIISMRVKNPEKSNKMFYRQSVPLGSVATLFALIAACLVAYKFKHVKPSASK